MSDRTPIIQADSAGGFRNSTIEHRYSLYVRGTSATHPIGAYVSDVGLGIDSIAATLSDLTGHQRGSIKREIIGAGLIPGETYSSHALGELEAGCLPMRFVVQRIR